MTPQQQADAFNAKHKIGAKCGHVNSPGELFETASEARVRSDEVVVKLKNFSGYWMVQNLVMEDEG